MPETPEQRDRRCAIHRHNGYTGSCRWTQTKMEDLMKLPTATDEARRIAKEIWKLTCDLQDALRTRRDPF